MYDPQSLSQNTVPATCTGAWPACKLGALSASTLQELRPGLHPEISLLSNVRGGVSG